MITLFKHNYDISAKRLVFDGKIVRDKNYLVTIFKQLLTLAHYSFHPVYRPVPAWLTNYRIMDYSYLYNSFKNVLSQLEFLSGSSLDFMLPENNFSSYLDLDAYQLESDGFHFIRINKDGSFINYGRVCRLTLSCNERGSDSMLTTLDRLSYYVDLFMKSPLTNKMIVLQ